MSKCEDVQNELEAFIDNDIASLGATLFDHLFNVAGDAQKRHWTERALFAEPQGRRDLTEAAHDQLSQGDNVPAPLF